MAQHDLDIANGSGATVRADINSALVALGTTQKGPNAPSFALAGRQWLEDDNPSSTVWSWRIYDGSDNILIGEVDASANRFTVAGSTIGKAILWAADAAAVRTEIGATATGGALITAASAAAARSTLGAKAAWEEIATATASASSSIDFTTGIDSTFRRYMLEVNDLTFASDNARLLLRLGTGVGPTWQAGASAYETAASLRTGAAHSPIDLAVSGIGSGVFLTGPTSGSFACGNQTGASWSGSITFTNPTASLYPKFFFDGAYIYPTSNGAASVNGSGRFGTVGAFTAVRLVALDSGGSVVNISTGTVRLIGMRGT